MYAITTSLMSSGLAMLLQPVTPSTVNSSANQQIVIWYHDAPITSLACYTPASYISSTEEQLLPDLK